MNEAETYGLYTLANDAVYDQLVALLNSIEKNISPTIPICIIPYNDNMDLVNAEIISRPQVSLFTNRDALKLWDDFVNEVWVAHPKANAPKRERPGWYKGFVHRKFAAFQGDFDRFIFFDADSLAMKPVDDIFAHLDNYDLVFNDWEHKKRDDIPEIVIEDLARRVSQNPDDIYPQLHCDSFFGAKREAVNAEMLDRLKTFLIDEEGVHCVRDRCWWSTSGLFSVMTVREGFNIFNFTRSPNAQERTGNCADADPFVDIDGVLHNEEGLKPIHRIHYMNYSSANFARLCKGEDVGIRYQDTFLKYRFLNDPDKIPKELVEASAITKAMRKTDKAYKKVKRIIG
ncbi:MAG: Npun_R2821/Npun_R2822 family protein [Cyanobacteria bacterium P01_D01_bin.73]